MVKTKNTVDKLLPKALEKKHKLKRWVIIVLSIIGFVALAVVVDVKLEDLYKDNGYTKEFENNFITSCKAQGSSSSDCECIYKLLKQDYSFDQTNSFDADPQSNLAKQALDTIVGKCKSR